MSNSEQKTITCSTKIFFRIYEYDTIDLLEFILAKNRLDVTNKILDDLSKILANHDQSGLK